MTRYFYLYEQTEDGGRFYVARDEGGTFIRSDAYLFTEETLPVFPEFDREYLPNQRPPNQEVLWKGEADER